jgi:hypothetical protein
VVAAASLLSGCVPPAASDPYRVAPSGAESLMVEVYNDHVMDMRVYLVRGGTPIPLGSVGSAERRVFRISSAELGHTGYIRLMADPLGSRETYTSDVIQVVAGQRVEWRLAHALALSSVTVRW